MKLYIILNFIILLLLLITQLSYAFDPKKCSMCTTSVDLMRRVETANDRENIIKYRLCAKFIKDECDLFIKEWVPQITSLMDSVAINQICPQLKLCAPIQ